MAEAQLPRLLFENQVVKSMSWSLLRRSRSAQL